MLQHDKDVRAVAFSSNGEFLAVGDSSREGSGTVKVWDVQKRQVIATLKDDLVVVRSVTFSSDDRYLASSHYNGEIKVWNVSDWQLLHTIPHAGDYDIAFSSDGKVIVGTSDGSVNLWWVEDGTSVAQLTGPAGWMHPVDFSHDGTSLAVGGEDGIVRVWHINTSLADDKGDGVQILHIDTYLQQFSDANSINGANIPDPIPPPAVVRDFFELDPFYEQWINVGGLPVIASAKVNPYALKEAVWLIKKMIGHRPDVLRGMVPKKVRFVVIGYTELLGEIPEYSHIRHDFLSYKIRGVGGSGVPELLGRPAVSSPEEKILAYPGLRDSTYNDLLHEFGHAIHQFGLRIVNPAFDKRLQITYEAAMEKGLWKGTYASSDRREYWAEGTHAWFYPNGDNSFNRFGNTRRALKEYDPELATLLTEVYGDSGWRYTPVTTRTHLPHLQGFDPQDSPTFQGWPELEELEREFRNPNSDGGDKWMDLKPYDPSLLPSLINKSIPPGDRLVVHFINLTQADVFVHTVMSDGTEDLWTRVPPGFIRGWDVGRTNDLFLIKDANGRNLVVFQAKGKLGRALIGATPRETPEEQPSLTVDVNADGQVNKTDLLHVVNALGKKATTKTRTDVNADGVVDVADLLLVIEHLDNPKDAAAPTRQEVMILLNPEMLSAHLSILHTQSDGTLKYQQAIGFLQSLLDAAYPERTLLHPNYPNPFNPETWIPYQLSEPAAVTLYIYAIDGRLIRRLVLGHQPAGMYQSKSRAAYWDGRNTVGEPVASGIYFYTFTAGDFAATRKMLIRK